MATSKLVLICMLGSISIESAESKRETDTAKSILSFEIKCGRDSTKRFYDDTSIGNTYIKHLLHKELETEWAYFIERKYYEGGDWILVSKKWCQEIKLFGPVIFSPNRQRIASVSSERETNYYENGVQIIEDENKNGYFTVQLADHINNNNYYAYGPESWKWVNDSVFEARVINLKWTDSLTRIYSYRSGMWEVRNTNFPKKNVEIKN